MFPGGPKMDIPKVARDLIRQHGFEAPREVLRLVQHVSEAGRPEIAEVLIDLLKEVQALQTPGSDLPVQ